MDKSIFGLTNKTVIVTGGVRGIGLACARTLHDAGANVAICDVSEDVKDVPEKIDPNSTRLAAYPLDVTKEDQIKRTFDEISERWQGVWGLVNNAGIVQRFSAFDVTEEVWRRHLDINLTGLFLCSRTAARKMIEGGGGSIVNIASIGGFSGGSHYPNPAYRASKGGVVNLTRALAVEWAGQGIRVNGVAPGWVRTPMISNVTSDEHVEKRILSRIPLGRIADPGDIASAVLFMIGDMASLVTGHTLVVDGGYLAQ